MTLLTIPEFAALVRRLRRTVEYWIYRRQIHTKRQFGRVLIPDSEAQRILVDRPPLKLWKENGA